MSRYFADLWESFWDPPSAVCPKCNSARVEYYDSFLFSPVRALTGRRRCRCVACRFVWRKSRSSAPPGLGGL